MDAEMLEAIRGPGRTMINAHLNLVRPGSVIFPESDGKEELNLEQKWSILKPFWQSAANTGYARSIRIALQDLFAFPDINLETLQPISDALQHSNQGGWYRTVLQDKAGIEKCVVDYGASQLELEFLHPALRFDRFFYMDSAAMIRQFEQENNCSIRSYDDLSGLLTQLIGKGKAEGMVAIKCALAYRRTLKFDKWSDVEVKRSFDRLMASDDKPIPFNQAKPLQDALFYRLLEHAADLHIPIQVHTGMQSGSGNDLRNSDPTLLCNLFYEHPSVKFCLMHAGYPFSDQAAVLAKTFPNAYIDMSWVPLISSTVARHILDVLLDMVPMNKIIIFGGDHVIVEGAYAAAKLTREMIKVVFEQKMKRGELQKGVAFSIARKIMYDNGKEFFRL